MMQSALYIGSALLILAGLILIWRDRRQTGRHHAAASEADPTHVDAVVEAIAARRRHSDPTDEEGADEPRAVTVTPVSVAPAIVTPAIVKPANTRPPAAAIPISPARVPVPSAAAPPINLNLRPAMPEPRHVRRMPSGTVAALKAVVAAAGQEWDDDARPEAVRNAHAEVRWRQMATMLDRAVITVNEVLAAADVAIGPAGEPGWSFKNRGFGTFRRVRVAGASTAWLRLEIMSDGQIEATLRAHDEVRSFLNQRDRLDAAAATDQSAADLVASVFARVAEYSGRNIPQRQNAEEQARQDWEAIADLIAGAIGLASAAIAASRGRIVQAGAPTWDPDHRRFYIMAPVLADELPLGQLGLARGAAEIDCVLIARPGLPHEATRRALVPTSGLTVEILAQNITDCIVPALAYAAGSSMDIQSLDSP